MTTDERGETALAWTEDVVPAMASSFDAFYVRHRDSMVRALAIALGSADAGADAADEAMARACARWSRVSAMANPAGWVYRVGLNAGRGRARRRGLDVAEAVPDAPVEADVPDLALRAAIGSLSPKLRAVVVARFLFDWSERQTADALGLRPGTVKSRLSRALDALRRDLED